jgi:hypothetical protein
MTKSKPAVSKNRVSKRRLPQSTRVSQVKAAKNNAKPGQGMALQSTDSTSNGSNPSKDKPDLPLITKLGIKPDSTITLLGEPVDFLKTLGKLPQKLKIRKTAQGDRDLTVWFPRDATELNRRIETIAGAVANGGLWIVWPKPVENESQAETGSELSQDLIRMSGRANGIVGSKICSIDATYAGVKFAKAKN